jgi:hypothetical protein
MDDRKNLSHHDHLRSVSTQFSTNKITERVLLYRPEALNDDVLQARLTLNLHAYLLVAALIFQAVSSSGESEWILLLVLVCYVVYVQCEDIILSLQGRDAGT